MAHVGEAGLHPPGTLVALSGAVDHAGAAHPRGMTKDRAVVFFVWEHPEHDEEYRGAPAAPPNPAVGAGGPPRSQLLRGAYRRECEAGPRAGAVQFTPWNCCVWMGCYRRFVEVCRIYAAYTPWQWMGVATDHEDDNEIVELKNLAH